MIHPVEDVMKKERPIFRRADESPDDAIHSPAPGQRVPILLLLVATLGLAYEAILLFTSFLAPYRFPIPYAVPIFDTPFVLVATGIGYLCLERHRMRQDFQSAAIGMSLWVAALLAAGHILTQPDYPGTPSLDPGVAPYLFFASYLAALTGVGLGAHFADRQLPLTDRGRVDDRRGLHRCLYRHGSGGAPRPPAPAFPGHATGPAHAVRGLDGRRTQRSRGSVGALELATSPEGVRLAARVREPSGAGGLHLGAGAHRLPAVSVPVRRQLVPGRSRASDRRPRDLRRPAA